MTRPGTRTFVLILAAAVLVSATGCGTILYPERRGQKTGDLDPGVVFLDAVGLLLFVVPGLVAFGVDFSTGAIFVPAENRPPERSPDEKTSP